MDTVILQRVCPASRCPSKNFKFPQHKPRPSLRVQCTVFKPEMLDFNDWVAERGGDTAKVRESQRRRFAPESAVDEVLELYAEARRGIVKSFLACASLLTC